MLRRHPRLVGLLTLSPFLWLALELVTMGAFAVFASTGRHAPVALGAIVLSTLVGCVTACVTLVLWVWFLVDACRSPIAESERTTWVLALVLGSVLAMPAYWYLRIWRAGRSRCPRVIPSSA
jgi:hypothetical protein